MPIGTDKLRVCPDTFAGKSALSPDVCVAIYAELLSAAPAVDPGVADIFALLDVAAVLNRQGLTPTPSAQISRW